MKKLLSSILCAVMLLSLAPTAFAAGGESGLSVFTNVKEYTNGVFQDVSDSAWYAASVKTAYDKGIMDGTGADRFNPTGTMPWSQAVTIAARLHAAYHGKTIPAAEGAWYVQYLSYAQANGLLPDICPDEAEVGTTPITREGLAVLFRSVLDEADLPAINDQAIPDLDEVRAEYRDAVSEMFASGIFTGTDGGQFNPSGQATRAQVATIVARLLCPGQRVSHDSRQNPNASYSSSEKLVRLGDTVYYRYNSPAHNIEMFSETLIDEDSIIARTDSGQLETLYSVEGENIQILSAGPDGILYFNQFRGGTPGTVGTYQDSLWQLNPKTGETKVVYKPTIGISIQEFFFYDGEIYLRLHNGKTNRYQIGYLKDGGFQTLASSQDGFTIAGLYAFGGKLYWLQNSILGSDKSLVTMDLETKETSSTNIKFSELAYQGATVYTAAWIDGNPQPKQLSRFSLTMPEVVEVLATYTGNYATWNTSFCIENGQMYWLDGTHKLWTITPTYEMELAAAFPDSAYVGCAASSQGIIGLTFGINNYEMVYTPDGQEMPYGAFLGQPYILEGHNRLTSTDVQAEWEPEEPDGSRYLYFQMTRAYVTTSGDLAVELNAVNPNEKSETLCYAGIKLGGSVNIERCFKLGSLLVPAGGSTAVTFVIPKTDVGSISDLSELTLEDYDGRLF